MLNLLKTYLLPFCARCKKRNYSVRDSGPSRDDDRVIDKLISAKLKEE